MTAHWPGILVLNGVGLLFLSQAALSQPWPTGKDPAPHGSPPDSIPRRLDQFPERPSPPVAYDRLPEWSSRPVASDRFSEWPSTRVASRGYAEWRPDSELPAPAPEDWHRLPDRESLTPPPPLTPLAPAPGYQGPGPEPAAEAQGPVLVPGPLFGPEPEPAPVAKLWEGGLELGLDGTEGNSQNFNLHFGARLKRKTDFHILSTELDYRKNRSESVETANKALLDSRFERLFHGSPWSWFIHNVEDYDQFKAYDLRVSVDTGFGYQFLKNDFTSVLGRLGAGTTWEIGGPDDTLIPDTVFGLEGEHKISQRQKLSASAEYRPDVTDFANYRLNNRAAWEILLDAERHVSMKVSVLDQYDSYADGRKPNDLDYTLTILWSF